MKCETCTNRRYCEQEEQMMCIANDYDRYDDDSIEYYLEDADMGNPYDQDIDTVKIIFQWTLIGNPGRAVKDMSNCCSAIISMIDSELGNLMLQNILRTAGTCHA